MIYIITEATIKLKFKKKLFKKQTSISAHKTKLIFI